MRRARLVAVVVSLSAALIGLVGVGGCYVVKVQRGAAVESLPALQALTSGGGPRFLFSIYGTSRPLGVAVSGTGERVYVTESDGQRETRIYDRDGVAMGALNPPGVAPAARAPTYVAVTPGTGEVYVSDRHANAIYRYSREGSYIGTVDPPAGWDTNWAPLALSSDAAGDLLLTNAAHERHELLVFAPDGGLLRSLDSERAGTSQWAYPNGVSADAQGRIALADSNNGRVVVLDRSGALLLTIGRGGGGPTLGLPRGVAWDNLNRLYVVDTINHHLMVYLVDGGDAQLLVSLGGEGIGDEQFEFPNGIALDQSGRLYIADRENNRVQVWTY